MGKSASKIGKKIGTGVLPLDHVVASLLETVKVQKPKIGNGSLVLPAARGKFYTVFGGPYRARPEGFVGVRLAAEIKAPADLVLPIRDFSIPDEDALFVVLDQTISAILRRKAVYAGCMGGMGRTGLFLAALVKLWGEPEPVSYVRRNYYARAVETEEQEDFIAFLEFPEYLQKKARLAKRLGWIPSRKNLTYVPEV